VINTNYGVAEDVDPLRILQVPDVAGAYLNWRAGC
jgi:hypothetical protein